MFDLYRINYSIFRGLFVAAIYANTYFLFFSVQYFPFPASIYLFKANNRNTRKRCEMCSKIIIKTQKDVIDVILMFLLLTVNIFHRFFYCFFCWPWKNTFLVSQIQKFMASTCAFLCPLHKLFPFYLLLVSKCLMYPTLREKCPNTEFFLVSIFLYLDWIQENTDQKKLRIWILFTQSHFLSRV